MANKPAWVLQAVRAGQLQAQVDAPAAGVPALRVVAQSEVVYQLADAATGQALASVKARRVGQDLWVLDTEGGQALWVLEGFYAVEGAALLAWTDAGTDASAALVAGADEQADAGADFVPTLAQWDAPILGQGLLAEAAGSGLLAGGSLGTGAVLLGAEAAGSGDTNTAAPTAEAEAEAEAEAVLVEAELVPEAERVAEVDVQVEADAVAIAEAEALPEAEAEASPVVEAPLEVQVETAAVAEVQAEAETALPAGPDTELSLDDTPAPILPMQALRSLTVAAAGDPPIDFGTRRNVAENTASDVVIFDVQARDDGGAPDVGITYSFGGADSALFSFNDQTGEIRFLSAPDYESPFPSALANRYVVYVSALDLANNRSTLEITFDVTNQLELVAPAINTVAQDDLINANEAQAGVVISGTGAAGATLSLGFSSKAILTGGNSTQVDGDGNWQFTLSAGEVALFGQGAEKVTAVQSTPTDGNSPSASRDFTVDTQGPGVGGEGDGEFDARVSRNVAENTPTSTVVYDVQANDGSNGPDAGIAYVLGGPDGALFVLDTATGEVRFRQSPDFENPLASAVPNAPANTYVVVISATDLSGNRSRLELTVKVTDVQELAPPVIDVVAQDDVINLAEASASVLLSGSAEPGATLVLSFTSGLVLAGGNSLSVGADGRWSVTLSAAEVAALGQGDETVTAVQSTPTGGTSPQAERDFSVDTLAPDAGVLNLLGYNDSGASASDRISNDRDFELELSGQPSDATVVYQRSTDGGATWTTTPRNQAAVADASYQFRAQVSDAAGNTSTTNLQALTVDATAAVFASASAISVDENTAAGATVYDAQANDGQGNDQRLVYSLAGNDAARFSINGATGAISFKASPDFESPTDVGANNVYNLSINATDLAGNVASHGLAITVRDVAEANMQGLRDATGNGNTVYSGSAAGTGVGLTANAVDPDANDRVSYSLTDNAGGRFVINASTGVVTTARGMTTSDVGTFAVGVKASSTDGSEATQSFNVSVQNPVYASGQLLTGAWSGSAYSLGGSSFATNFAGGGAGNYIQHSFGAAAGQNYSVSASFWSQRQNPYKTVLWWQQYEPSYEVTHHGSVVVYNPYGQVVASQNFSLYMGNSTGVNFGFTAQVSGNYTFRFTNTSISGDAHSTDLNMSSASVTGANLNQLITPLVLDLDGNGVQTLALQDGVAFDVDGDGQVEQTGWVAPTDGLLALDLNLDGFINDGQELFGAGTVMANGVRAQDGFEALAQYDQNQDGLIDASDAVFAYLRVWIDANSDGVSDLGELVSLESLGVAAIRLAHTASDEAQNGNAIALQGSYIKADGSEHQLADVMFQTQQQLVDGLAGQPLI